MTKPKYTMVVDGKVVVKREMFDHYMDWLRDGGMAEKDAVRVGAALVLSECREWRRRRDIA